MTVSTPAPRSNVGARMLGLGVSGNLGGAVLTFLDFHDVDPTAVSGGMAKTSGEIADFVVAFGLLFLVGKRLSARWVSPLTQAGSVPPPGPCGDRARRRALLVPAFAGLIGGGWVAAAFIRGVVWPLLAGHFELGRSLRLMFGITFVAGSFVTAIVFFGSARPMRVRTRMLAVFALV